jgi:hypothetical protein
MAHERDSGYYDRDNAGYRKNGQGQPKRGNLYQSLAVGRGRGYDPSNRWRKEIGIDSCSSEREAYARIIQMRKLWGFVCKQI